MIFAQFLGPKEFGTYSYAIVLIGLATKAAAFGAVSIIVQRPTLDNSVVSTVLYITMAFTVIFLLVLLSGSSKIALFLGEPKIAELIPFLTIGMLAVVTTETFTGVLRRNLQMRSLARRTIFANTLSALIAAPFVLYGYGAFALALQYVSGAILTLVFSLALMKWPFGYSFDRTIAGEVVRFGAPVMFADLLNQYSREAPKLLIGFFLGVETLGLFAMASRFMNLLQELIGGTLMRVLFPTIAEITRTVPKRLGGIFLRIYKASGIAIIVTFLPVILLHEPIIELLLDPDWKSVAPTMAVLCIAGMFTTFSYVSASTLVAIGKPGARLQFAIIHAAILTIFLGLSVSYGLLVAAASMATARIVVEVCQLGYLLTHLGVGYRRFALQEKNLIAVGATLICALYPIVVFMADAPPIVTLFVCTGATVTVAYVLVSLLEPQLIIELKASFNRLQI